MLMGAHRGQSKTLDTLALQSQVAVGQSAQVVGTELGAFAKASSASKYGDLSPVHFFINVEKSQVYVVKGMIKR